MLKALSHMIKTGNQNKPKMITVGKLDGSGGRTKADGGRNKSKSWYCRSGG